MSSWDGRLLESAILHIFCSLLSNWACQSVNTYLLGVYVANQTNPFPELLLLCSQGLVIHTQFLIAILVCKVDSSMSELQREKMGLEE